MFKALFTIVEMPAASGFCSQHTVGCDWSFSNALQINTRNKILLDLEPGGQGNSEPGCVKTNVSLNIFKQCCLDRS